MVAVAVGEKDIQGMRIAGQKAASVLEMIEPFVQPGISTEELDQRCHQFIVEELDCVPAPLNYGSPPFPKSICTSLNHVVCHGIPSSSKTLKNGDSLNIDITVITKGWLLRRHEQNVFCRSTFCTFQKTFKHHQRMPLQGHREGDCRKQAGGYRPCNSGSCRKEQIQCRPRVLRSRHSEGISRRAPSFTLWQSQRGNDIRERHVFHC